MNTRDSGLLPPKHGGRRDNRKRRPDDKRGGYRGAARLKIHYTLSEEAARIVKDEAAADGIDKDEWLDRLIRAARRGPTKEGDMYTYRITVNERDLGQIQTISYDHIGFDDDGNEIIEITTERDVSAQLDTDPAVIRYSVV